MHSASAFSITFYIMDVDVGSFPSLYPAAPPATTPPPSHPQTVECRERRSYTLQYKLEVVGWLEKHGSSLRQASKHFGITRRVIRTWFEQRDQLREALHLNDPNKRKLHSGRPPASEELDKRVLDFLTKQRDRRVSVSDCELRRQALEYGYQLGLGGFKANLSWLRRWKQRCGVEIQNGTNDIVVKKEKKLAKSTFLSHVDPGDGIKLIAQHSNTDLYDMTTISGGPVYLDFTTSEHNYCRKAHQPSLFITSAIPGLNIEAAVGEDIYNSHGLHCHHLGSEQDISTLAPSSETADDHMLGDLTAQRHANNLSTNNAHPSSSVVESGLELIVPTNASVVQELVEGLALPLGHEEVVGESSGGKDGELIITQAATSLPAGIQREQSLLLDRSLSSQDHHINIQSYFTSTSPSHQQTLLSPNFPRETASRLPDFVSLQNAQDYLTEVNSFLQDASGSSQESNSPTSTISKARGGKKRCQPKRASSSRSKVTTTKTKKTLGQKRARAVTPPVATFPNLILDDPQGYSGLLASRISQPIFPGEPEFVYTDMATSH